MMKILRVLGIAIVCMVMALPVNSVGYQTTLFVSPIASLTWGMRREEIVERFELKQTPIQNDDNFIWLTAEQLGWNPADYLGLELRSSGSDSQGVQISFMQGDSLPSEMGVNRLSEITFNVTAPNIQAAIHRFTRLYGEPIKSELRGDTLRLEWLCYPYEEGLTEEEERFFGRDGSSLSRCAMYPRLILKCRESQNGDVICEVSYYAGIINFPTDFIFWFKC